jgi:hypothetical protein
LELVKCTRRSFVAEGSVSRHTFDSGDCSRWSGAGPSRLVILYGQPGVADHFAIDNVKPTLLVEQRGVEPLNPCLVQW